MNPLAVLLLAGLLAVTSLAPGMLLVRRLRWNPLEKLCGAFAASLALVYLVALLAFWFHLANGFRWSYGAACLFAGLFCLRDVHRLFRTRPVRRTLTAFAIVLLWTLALLSLARHYAGGPWSRDWIVHYEKSLAFLAGPHAGAQLLDRPPAMNLIWSYYLALAGRRFEHFQLVGLLLNTLIFLPCSLLAGAVFPRGGRRPVIVAALFMLNPLFVQNVTYTWTKLFAGFYTVLGIGLYLAALRKRDPIRLAWALSALAFGCLVHFAAVPYAAFIVLHALLATAMRRGMSWRGAAGAIVCGALVLGTWYGWTLLAFGPRANAAANPTLSFFGKHSTFDNVQRVARNAINTIVPLPLRVSTPYYAQPSRWGHIRDHAFMAYEDNFILSMGSVGGMVAAWLTFRLLARRKAPKLNVTCAAGALVIVLALLAVPVVRDVVFVALPNVPLVVVAVAIATWALARACTNVRHRAGLAPLRPERRFWRRFLIIVPLVGIAAQDQYTDFGLVHICLQPVTLMGVTLVAAAAATLSRRVRLLLAAGAAVDFLLGIFLHFSLQRYTFEDPAAHGLLDQAARNWNDKQAAGLVFVGDHLPAGAAPVIQAALLAGAAGAILILIRARRVYPERS
jgi:hypothetical protein